MLFEGCAKLSCHRFGQLLADHFQSRGKGMPGADGPSQQINSLGKILFELPQTPVALDGNIGQGKNPSQTGGGHGKQCSVVNLKNNGTGSSSEDHADYN